MDSKKFKILTISLIIALAISGIYFLVGIILNSYQGSLESQSSFAMISNEITDYADDYGILTQEFLEKSENLLQKEKYLNAITIQKDSVVFYAYPISSKLLRADEKGNAFISSSSPLTKIFTKNVLILNGDSLTITAAYNTVLPENVFYTGKISFIIILISFIITIIAITYIKTNNKNLETTDNKIEKELKSSSNENIMEVSEPENMIEINEESIAETKSDILLTETEIEDENYILEENIEQNEENENKIEVIEETFEPKFTEKNDPMGLFSGITGFGWESYFEPRLDSELVRATSSEQDVSLFIITLPELNKKSKAAEEIYQVILDFFKYRDMIFEYKDDSFAGIHVNMNLESAINYAEQLFINLYSIYEAHGLTSKIGIGITTRSMRLVPGARLISEAEQAAQKALEEEAMPIVAFKVNHDRYRDYVAEES